MQIAVLGIDLGKNSCSVAGQDAAGQVVRRKRVRRENLVKLTAELPPCVGTVLKLGGLRRLRPVQP